MAFSQGDAEVIARFIKEMETGDDVQRPETWDFVRWSDGGERRITEIDLSNRAAAGRVETAYEDSDSIVFTMPDWDITVRAEPKRK